MRFSVLIAAAALAAPAVFALSHHDSGKGMSSPVMPVKMMKGLAPGTESAHHPDNKKIVGKMKAASGPGYPEDGDHQGDPSPEDSDTTPFTKNDDDEAQASKARTKPALLGTRTLADDTEMEAGNADPSAMPPAKEGSYFSRGREYRARAVEKRQDDDGEGDDGTETGRICDLDNKDDCESRHKEDKKKDNKEDDDDADDNDDDDDDDDDDDVKDKRSFAYDSDNEKYLARVKRVNEQYIKAQAFKRNAIQLKQASRREVVERARNGRRAGSRPSASPMPVRK